MNLKTKSIKLRMQLLAVLISTALIPIVAIAISTYITTIEKITDLSLNTLKSNAYNTMKSIDAQISSIDSMIKGVSAQPDFLVGLEVLNSGNQTLDTAIYSAIQIAMRNVVESSNKLIEAMYLCDKNGKIMISGTKNYQLFADKYFYDLEVFKDITVLSTEQLEVGAPFYSEELKKQVIPITKPLRSLAGFSGSITALLNYGSFFSLVDNEQMAGEILILDEDFTLIFHQNREKMQQGITDESLTAQLAKNSEYMIYTDDQTQKVLSVGKTSFGEWLVGAQMDYSVVMSPVRQYIIVLALVIVAALVLALVISLIYSGYIVRPVTELIKQMKRVEDGDLNIDAASSASHIEEINILRMTFNKMVQNLQQLIANISMASREIHHMTGEMNEATSCSLEKSEETQKSIFNIDENIKKQAADATLAAKGIESLARQIQTSGELSQNVYNYLGLLNRSAENGKIQINHLRMKASLNQRNTHMMNGVIIELLAEMKQIHHVTNTIQGIARQTKLLSLNASIEASRAGTAGESFAVVAQEIKKLSEQTSMQADVIKNMIDNIAINSEKLSGAFTEVSEGTDAQNESVSGTIASFTDISGYIEKMNIQLGEMNDYLQEMTSQKDELVQLVNAISVFSSEIAISSNSVEKNTYEQIAAIEQTYINSNVFNVLAEKLNASVKSFKISN